MEELPEWVRTYADLETYIAMLRAAFLRKQIQKYYPLSAESELAEYWRTTDVARPKTSSGLALRQPSGIE